MSTVTSESTARSWLMPNNNIFGFLFMLPAAIFLVCFLALTAQDFGVWLGFTDTRIGRDGIFIGLENYQFLAGDSVFWLSVFNTLLYTFVASVLKFVLGLWLALLLNQHLPFKSFFRAIVFSCFHGSFRRCCRGWPSGRSAGFPNSRSFPGR